MALRKIEVIPGTRYNSLTVIQEADSVKNGKYKIRMVLCKCDCGNETIVRLDYLRRNHTTSCGCKIKTILSKNRKTHGYTKERLYRVWAGMKNRCFNPNVKSYKDYGAKGVTVCEEWKKFEPFKEWALANGYEEHLTIERKNPYKNYEPTNCEWIPKEEQYKNRRSNFKGDNHDKS